MQRHPECSVTHGHAWGRRLWSGDGALTHGDGDFGPGTEPLPSGTEPLPSGTELFADGLPTFVSLRIIVSVDLRHTTSLIIRLIGEM
jgi:hypothetical protein